MNGGNFNVSARIAVKSSGAGFIVGVGKTTSTVVYKSTPTILPLNTSHLLILKYRFVTGNTADDIVSVITNPDLLYAEPAAEVATSLGNDVTTAIDRINLPFNAASKPVGNMGTINISTNWIGRTVVAASPFTALNISKDRNNFITLNWDIHDPSIIHQFIVEQSDNAASFSKIGEQTASSFKHYSHPIISPITSCYYRIKLVLKDGSIFYSNVIKYSSTNKTKLSVYPIPAKRDLQVKLTIQQDEWITCIIINMQGMPVLQKKQFLFTGANFMNINIENLAPQSYALVVQGTNTNEKTIFIKQ
jgi:hypothetical protein